MTKLHLLLHQLCELHQSNLVDVAPPDCVTICSRWRWRCCRQVAHRCTGTNWCTGVAQAVCLLPCCHHRVSRPIPRAVPSCTLHDTTLCLQPTLDYTSAMMCAVGAVAELEDNMFTDCGAIQPYRNLVQGR